MQPAAEHHLPPASTFVFLHTAHSLHALPPPSSATTRPPRDGDGQGPSAPPPSSREKRVAGTYPAADRREATSGFVHAAAETLEARASRGPGGEQVALGPLIGLGARGQGQG